MKKTLIHGKLPVSTAIAAVAVVLLTRCTTDLSGGGGSEAGNARVAGIVSDEHGVPAANVIVQLFPSDFDPVLDAPVADSFIDTTTDDGRYRFIVADEALRYSVLATQMVSHLRGFIADVKAVTTEDAAANCSLQPPGTVRVSVRESRTTDSGYFYIPGTTLWVRVNTANGYALLDSVPAGILPSINYSSNDGDVRTVVQTDVEVIAGDTVTIAMQGWLYSGTIVLNTSVTGADVPGAVYGFPVLIRLSATTFNFAQTKSHGEDLRFVSSGGEVLPHEIELWDAAAGRAAVWVNVDTVRGNDSLQSITMYWGNPEAPDMSTGAAVFDTANGFQGVWHLGDGADGPVGDATVNGYHGMSPDSARPQVAEGVIGNCRAFDGIADYITMPNTAVGKLNFPVEGYYTVSAWVVLDSLDNTEHLVVAKGYEQYFLRFSYFPSDSPLWEFSEFGKGNSWQACTTTAAVGKWTLLTGVRKGGAQLLYCNGVLVCNTPNVYQSTNLSRNTSYDLSIGKLLETVKLPNDNYGSCFYRGAIDEVRILSSAQSSDWVRLCYMNQRADDRLVVFR